MNMAYTTRQVADLFGVSRETVRSWATEFEAYLSPTATPGDGRRRQFVDDDLRVFALIHEQKQAGLLFEDIHGALRNGLRAEVPTGDELAITTGGQQQMAVLAKRVSELENALHGMIRERDVIKAERDLLERQLKETRDRMDDLVAKAARAETLLEIERNKKKGE